jgi:hypothetical protein
VDHDSSLVQLRDTIALRFYQKHIICEGPYPPLRCKEQYSGDSFVKEDDS